MEYRIQLQIMKFFFSMLSAKAANMYRFFMPAGISEIFEKRIFSCSHLATLLSHPSISKSCISLRPAKKITSPFTCNTVTHNTCTIYIHKLSVNLSSWQFCIVKKRITVRYLFFSEISQIFYKDFLNFFSQLIQISSEVP